MAISKKPAATPAAAPATPTSRATAAKPKFKIPKTIGACADRLYELKAQISDLRKASDALDEERKAIQEYVINNLPKSEATGVAGKLARVTVVTKQVPQVEDWDKFYAYVKKTGSFDLMSRSISAAAIKERWENKKDVPGVKAFEAVSISLNKV
jgi:hypothetical protein